MSTRTKTYRISDEISANLEFCVTHAPHRIASYTMKTFCAPFFVISRFFRFGTTLITTFSTHTYRYERKINFAPFAPFSSRCVPLLFAILIATDSCLYETIISLLSAFIQFISIKTPFLYNYTAKLLRASSTKSDATYIKTDNTPITPSATLNYSEDTRAHACDLDSRLSASNRAVGGV